MKKALLIPMLCFGFLTLCTLQTVQAQQPDFSSVDVLVKQLYDSIESGPQHNPDWSVFKQLFIPEARLGRIRDEGYELVTPAGFAANYDTLRARGVIQRFKEHEIGRTTERFGNVMHVFSTYESDYATNEGPQKARGINSIQLIRQDGRWWVATIIWDVETPDRPIPSQYLNQ